MIKKGSLFLFYSTEGYNFRPYFFLTLTNEMKEYSLKAYIVLLTVIAITLSCERDVFKDGSQGSFQFSADTVNFDTIFTNQGTSTYKLVLKNPNNFKLYFDSVYLAKKGNTGFIVNIDGISATSLKGLNVDSKDSIYIFIQSYPALNKENNALLLKDSLVFVSGSHQADIKLIAVAQNVTSFRDENIGSQEWTSDKPYLIFGTLTVDSAKTLTINEGTRVYFHRNARMVVKGRLVVNGSWQHPVLFKPDRLEKDYDSIPGQWSGIFLQGNDARHLIYNAIIRNGTTGITIGEAGNEKVVKVGIYNTRSLNMGYSALIAYHAEMEVQNCLLGNCVNSVCSLLDGGKYEFIHCTFGNYGAKYVSPVYNARSLVLQNYIEYVDDKNKLITHINEMDNIFGNCIFYGFSDEELALKSKTEKAFGYKFENCVVRVSASSSLKSDPDFINCKFSEDPKFKDPYTENFRLDTLSAAKDAGKPEYGQMVPIDLDNNSRISDLKPDAGAYERIQK